MTVQTLMPSNMETVVTVVPSCRQGKGEPARKQIARARDVERRNEGGMPAEEDKGGMSESTVSTTAESEGDPPVPCSKIEWGGFTAVEKLGAGSFAEVWRGIQKGTDLEVAMKFDSMENNARLLHEARSLMKLCEDSSQQGVVKCYDIIHKNGMSGSPGCIIMEKLGCSLKERLDSYNGCGMSLQTTVLIAEQVLQRIEYVHSKGIIHRDIKPDNFVFGVGPRQHHIYLIDFGLCKPYWFWDAVEDKWKHLPFKGGYKRGGSPRYCSLNVHKGVEQGRRDDLESTAYLFLVLLNGRLPWCSCVREEEKVAWLKEFSPIKSICAGAPQIFEKYLEYCRGLELAERPNYKQLYDAFRSLRSPNTEDYDYQWLAGKSGNNDGDFCPQDLETLKPYVGIAQPDDLSAMPNVCSITSQNNPQKPSSRNSVAGLLGKLFKRGSKKNIEVRPM